MRVNDWVVKITHPALVAGTYGPMDKTTAEAVAAAWPHPCSAFPHQLKPVPVLVGHLTRLTEPSNEEKEGAA